MASFTATLTLAREHPGSTFADQIHDSDLAAFGAITSTDPHGRAQVTITLEATSLTQATILANRLLQHLPDPVRLDLMTTHEYDHATTEPPAMLSVTEYAERHGVTRQSILGRIQRGTLTAHRIGSQWMIPDPTPAGAPS